MKSNDFKKRALAFMLVVLMLLSNVPAVFGAEVSVENDIKTGYENGVLSLHNSELTRNTSQIKEYFGYGTLDTVRIKLGETVQWTSSDNWGQSTLTFEHGNTYNVEKYVQTGTTGGWIPIPKYEWVSEENFIVKVYDTLTINTTIGTAATTTTSTDIYRGDSVVVNVADKSAENYTVKVSGAKEGITAGNYTVSDLTGDTELSIVYTLDTQSTVSVKENEGVSEVTGTGTVDAVSNVSVKITPVANQYITNATVNVAVDFTTKYENGSLIVEFVTGEKTDYVIDVETAPILEVTAIDYYKGMTAQQFIDALKVTVGGQEFDSSKLTVKYDPGRANTGMLEYKPLSYIPESWDIVLNGAFGETDSEKIEISYISDNSKYQNATITGYDVTDDRENAPIELKDATYSWTDVSEGISLETILSEAYMNYSAPEGTKITIDGADAINGIPALTSFDDETVAAAAKGYTVKAEYEATSSYKAASKTATFTVVDKRIDTVIESEDAVEITMKIAPGAPYTIAESKVLKAIGASIEGVEDAEFTLVDYTAITAKGEYKVTVSFAGSGTHKADEKDVTVTVREEDGRDETIISVEKESISYPVENLGDISFTAKDMLEFFMPVVMKGDLEQYIELIQVKIVENGVEKDFEDDEALEALGEYQIKFVYGGNSDLQPSSKLVTFKIVDGRKSAAVEWTDVTEIDYYELVRNDKLNNDEIISLILAGVKDPAGKDIADYTVTVNGGSFRVGGKYTVKVTVADTDTFKGVEAASQEFTFVDNRIDTTIEFSGDKVNYVFEQKLTKADVEKALIKGVYAGGEKIADVESATMSVDIYSALDIEGMKKSGNLLISSFAATIESVAQSGKGFWLPISEISTVSQLRDGLVKEYPVIKGLADELLKYLDHDLEHYKYKLVVSYKGDNTYKPVSPDAEQIFTLADLRLSTVIHVENEIIDVTYGEFTPEYVMNQLSPSVYAVENGNETIIEGAVVEFTENITALDAGERKVIVEFAETSEYKASTFTFTLNIAKADSDLTVNSQTVNFGETVNELITETKGADYIDILAGINLGTGKVTLDVNIPNLDVLTGLSELGNLGELFPEIGNIPGLEIPDLGLDNIMPGLGDIIGSGLEESTYVTKLVNDFLESSVNGEISVVDLNAALENIKEQIKNDPEGIGQYVSEEVVDKLLDVVFQVGNLDGVGNIVINVTYKKEVKTPTDSGIYFVGGIVSDKNYHTTMDIGYLVIVPKAQQVDLKWNYVDENGIFTKDAVGKMDLGASVVEDGLTAEDVTYANKAVRSIHLGVDVNGDIYISNDPSGEIGAYTQFAYIADLGNVIYYAEPIIRVYAIVADFVDVKFVDANENNAFSFVYDNTSKAVDVEVYTRGTDKLVKNYKDDLTVRYIGIEGDAEGYNSTVAPSQVGAYTVIATYINDDYSFVGMNVAAMVITPAKAEISVENHIHTYDETKVDVVKEMITVTGQAVNDDVKFTVITAGIDVSGDFTENGWEAVKGIVNVDFPSRFDSVLRKYAENAYENGIGAADVASKLTEAQKALAELGYDSLLMAEVIGIVNQIPDDIKVTFKEQAEVNPYAVGAYVIGAVITDPNYIPEVGAGILVIGPSVQTAELKWNYDDENGIITSPSLYIDDLLGAKAYDKETGEELTQTADKISYIFIGIDETGTLKLADKQSDLDSGLYTQIAYMHDLGAKMVVAKPIMRTILVAPRIADVRFVNEAGDAVTEATFTFDGTPKVMNAVAKDENGNVLTGTMKYQYTGIESDGDVYFSETAPSQCGVYTVIAAFANYDDAGRVSYAGIGSCTMIIKPAPSDFEVNNVEITWDGNAHLEEAITNTKELTYIAMVIDNDEPDTVNFIFPEAWNVEEKTFVIGDDIDSLENLIAKLPENIANSKYVAKIREVLSDITVEKVIFNGGAPTDCGTYAVRAIADKFNYDLVADGGVITINHKEIIDPEKPASEPDCTNVGYTQGTKCEGCNIEMTAQEEIPATGHTEVVDEAVEPKCEETGLTEGSHCEVCGEVIVKQEEIPATGHKFTGYKSNNDAECEKDGTKTAICDNGCGTEDTVTDEGSAKGHTEETVPGTEATCEDSGLTDGVRCSVCEKILVEQEEIPATGHDWSDWEVVYEADCGFEGEKKRECADCDKVEKDVIPVVGEHDWEKKIGCEASCTESGYYYELCKVCSSIKNADVNNGSVEIPATGHTWSDWTTVKSTCTEDGYDVRECSVCEMTETKNIVEADHTWNEEFTVDKAADCTTDGSKSIHCANCDAAKDNTVIPKLGHTYDEGEVTTKPTCTTAGVKTFTCVNGCGDSYTEPVKATGHTMGEWKVVTEATCTTKGTEERKCDNCDHVETRETALKGHTEKVVNAKDATCEAEGYTGDTVCSECDAIIKNGTSIAAKGHKYGEGKVTKEATCKEDGEMTYECVNGCGEPRVEVIKGGEHKYVLTGVIDVTCMYAGYTGDTVCEFCGDVKEKGVVVPAGYGIRGDVNGDGDVNALDATQILRYSNMKTSEFSGLEGDDLRLLEFIADVNCDGDVNALDATQILRHSNMKTSVFNNFVTPKKAESCQFHKDIMSILKEQQN